MILNTLMNNINSFVTIKRYLTILNRFSLFMLKNNNINVLIENIRCPFSKELRVSFAGKRFAMGADIFVYDPIASLWRVPVSVKTNTRERQLFMSIHIFTFQRKDVEKGNIFCQLGIYIALIIHNSSLKLKYSVRGATPPPTVSAYKFWTSVFVLINAT